MECYPVREANLGARGAKVVKDRTGGGGVVIIEGVSELEFRSREMLKNPVCGRWSPQRPFSECCNLSSRSGA